MHPTIFLTTLGMTSVATFTPFSPNDTLSTKNTPHQSHQKKAPPALDGIKNESISKISPVPDKKYKSVKERLDNLGTNLEDASSSSQVDIVAKDKRKAAKIIPLPISMKKKQKVQLNDKLSPLI